jgi:lipopolysaccharide/colanic/teichoic acid biosynthesis glycosyltransferase/glycosyltransferase involved in cell wall biosynthesis
MRILLLTQWFDPEPAFKGLLFARELAARGHEVEVLTGFPNYPGGRVYPGYRIRPWMREQIDGISILRVALYPSHDNSAIGRILNYASFAISAALTGTALIKTPDIVYVYHPPATVGLAAMVIRLFRKAPFVYDIQDLWPDTVALSGMMSRPAAVTLLDKWCNLVYRCARYIVVLSPGFKQQLVRRGVPPEKIDVIYNWSPETTLHPAAPCPELASMLEGAGYFNVMFAGTMGTAQALDSVLDAAGLCLETHPTVRFVFIGGGVERKRLETKAADLELTNVHFLPRRPMDAMETVLSSADVLLVHLKDHPLFRITIPSKTQAYMAAGKPVLMAVGGDAANLVIESGGGLVCEPENPKSLADAVARFVQMSPEERRSMGEAGKKFYDERLSLKNGVTRFEALFSGICEKHAPPGFYSSRVMTFVKRCLDLWAAALGLILLSPLFACTAVLVRLSMGRPILFRQRRIGYQGRPFWFYKFRTMSDARDDSGKLLPDSDRLGRIGQVLRATSVDELPQLWNVICGEMSLVGPRPLLPEYLPRYSLRQRRRHRALPGITGWAQVNGRNNLTWEQKFDLDVWYVDHMSFWLDVNILWTTIRHVLRRDGISQQGHATMQEFKGSEK